MLRCQISNTDVVWLDNGSLLGYLAVLMDNCTSSTNVILDAGCLLGYLVVFGRSDFPSSIDVGSFGISSLLGQLDLLGVLIGSKTKSEVNLLVFTSFYLEILKIFVIEFYADIKIRM